MDFINEIQTVIKRLESIKRLQNPDDSIQEQLYDIENNLLPQLDKRFDDYMNKVYEKGEPDGVATKLMDDMGDAFIQADILIHDIREKFGLESNEDDEQDDDELFRTPLPDEGIADDVYEDMDDYDIVLREVSQSALRTIGLDYEDENNISLMEDILIGIESGEDDVTIAGKKFANMVLTGFVTPMETIKEMCVETREKCKKQLLGLQIAYSSLDEYHCTAADALAQIQMFL